MQKRICPVSNNSLRFSRLLYGGLALVSYLSQNYWVAGVVGVLMIIGMLSVKFDIVYQFYLYFLKKFFKEEHKIVQKEQGELSFVCGMAGFFLFTSFLLLSFGKFVSFSWVFVLTISGLLILSGITGSCIVSLFYVFFKKALKIK